MKKTFNDLSKVQGYHIHIYFEQGQPGETAARELLEDLQTVFGTDIEHTYKIGKVGPHLYPNYAAHITKEGFVRIAPWLQMNNRDNLSILLHPETGDDLKDHLEASMWLGKQLPYNDAFFDRVRALQALRP